MNSLENIILNAKKNKSSIELINYLTEYVAEKCGDEIDAALARSSLQCRSISSSLSGGSGSNVEKRLMHRRLRSAVNYFGNSTKFQNVRIHLIRQIQNCILHSAKNRPSTGFETLFSVDEFSDDDTLFLTNFSFSQSLKISKADNLDGIVGILCDPNVASQLKLTEMKKLFSISPLAIFRSPTFKILLQHFQIIINDPMLFGEYLSLLSSIANIRDFTSFFIIFETFQQNSSFILQNSKIHDSNKLKFVDLIKQMFEYIPSISRRRNNDEISELMKTFMAFFNSPESNNFLIIYSCIEANATNFEGILHYHNLRHSINNQWTDFIITVIESLPKLKKDNFFPAFSICSQSSLWSFYRAFLSTIVLISIKYLPWHICERLKIEDFLMWILQTAFVKKAQKGDERSSFCFYLQNKLKKAAEDQAFADLVAKALESTTDPSTTIPLSLSFAKFLLVILQHSLFSLPTLSITVIKELLLSKQRSSIFIAIQIIDQYYSSNCDSSLIQSIFTPSIAAKLLGVLHPLNPIHSSVLFKSGLSSSKQYWRQFRPRSILHSPGINHIQHYHLMAPEDKIAGLKIITSFLIDDEDDEMSSPQIQFLIEFPRFLVDIIKSFDFASFFEENLEKCLRNSEGNFLKRFSMLLKNVDFASECRKVLNLPGMVITHLQQYAINFDQKFVIDEHVDGCVDVLKALTLGHCTEVIDILDFKNFKLKELTKGCYKFRQKTLLTKMPISSPINTFEDLCKLLGDCRNHQLPFAEIVKQKLSQASTSESDLIKTAFPAGSSFYWFLPVCHYAVFLEKTSSWQIAHRQSLLLKLPFFDFEGNDLFSAAMFLALKCSAKNTSEILANLCSSPIDIRCFWAASHETIKEFVDYLAADLWPKVCSAFCNHKKRPRFGEFLEFVYRCGIGMMEFREVEEYLLAVFWGGKTAVIAYFITFWQKSNVNQMGIDKILECYSNLK